MGHGIPFGMQTVDGQPKPEEQPTKHHYSDHFDEQHRQHTTGNNSGVLEPSEHRQQTNNLYCKDQTAESANGAQKTKHGSPWIVSGFWN